MNRKYFRYLIKQWIAYLFVMFVVIATPGIISAFVLGTSPLMLETTIPAVVMTFVMPLAVYSYRHTKQGADTYLMFPEKPKSIRNTRLLTGLGMLEIALSAAYWIVIGILAVKQAASGLPMLHYGWAVPAYFAIVILVGLQYFINCFFVSMTDSMRDACIVLLAGAGALSLIVNGPNTLLLSFGANVGAANAALGFGPAYPCYLMNSLFGSLMRDGQTAFFQNFGNNWREAFSFVGFLLLGVAAIFYTIFHKDPSGEHFAGRGPNTPYMSLPIHVCFLLLACMQINAYSSMMWTILYGLLSFAWIGAIYFGTMAFYYHTFKLPLREIIIISSVMAVFLVTIIVVGAVNPAPVTA